MTTSEIMCLDYRKEENQEKIQKVLRKIKPLSKYSDEEDIPFEVVEKCITVMSKKYCMRIKEFVPDVWAGKDTIWRATYLDETNLNTTNIYGMCIYEIFAKCAIKMYGETRKGFKTRK